MNAVIAALVTWGSALAGCGDSGDAAPDVLTVENAWARPTPVNATDGVVYLSIVSPADDVLIGADVPASVAASATLHETMTEGGEHDMATMSDVGGQTSMMSITSVELSGGEVVRFEPGGKHLMLSGLVEPLDSGATFQLTLHLRDAGDRQVTVAVLDNAPDAASAGTGARIGATAST